MLTKSFDFPGKCHRKFHPKQICFIEKLKKKCFIRSSKKYMISPFGDFLFVYLIRRHGWGQGLLYKLHCNFPGNIIWTLSFLNGLKVETWFLDSMLGVKRTSRFFFGLSFPLMVQQLEECKVLKLKLVDFEWWWSCIEKGL